MPDLPSFDFDATASSGFKPISEVREVNARNIDDFLDSPLGDLLFKLAVGVVALTMICCLACQLVRRKKLDCSPKKLRPLHEDMEALAS